MKEWITGRNPVCEVLRAKRRVIYRLLCFQGLQANARLQTIFALSEQAHIPIEKVDRDHLDFISPNNQGVALQVSAYPYVQLQQVLQVAQNKHQPPLIVLLDQLQDPQNFGSLLRTAEAVGVHGVVIPTSRAAGVTPAVVNSSSGATEFLSICQANLSQAIDYLKQQNIWMYGLEYSENAPPIQEVKWSGPIGLVVGSEGTGLRDLVKRKCDFLLKLPMVGQIESLNAAVAGSIALYWAFLYRQKQASK